MSKTLTSWLKNERAPWAPCWFSASSGASAELRCTFGWSNKASRALVFECIRLLKAELGPYINARFHRCPHKVYGKMNRLLTSIFVFLLSSISSAEPTLEQRAEALQAISDFADRFCKEVPLQGKSDAVDLTGQARAELDGIIKKLASLGIEGEGRYSNSEFQGLIQKDLSEALKSNVDCRRMLWNDLRRMLFSEPMRGDSNSLPPESALNASTIIAIDKSAQFHGVGYRDMPNGRRIDRIVILDSQSDDTAKELAALKESGVAYHYLIDRSGRILRLVDDKNIAYHTRGQNQNSIGIGLIHNSGGAYPNTQLGALKALIASVADTYNISSYNIYPASVLDKSKKSDIGAFLPGILP